MALKSGSFGNAIQASTQKLTPNKDQRGTIPGRERALSQGSEGPASAKQPPGKYAEPARERAGGIFAAEGPERGKSAVPGPGPGSGKKTGLAPGRGRELGRREGPGLGLGATLEVHLHRVWAGSAWGLAKIVGVSCPERKVEFALYVFETPRLNYFLQGALVGSNQLKGFRKVHLAF